jgi:hypothetical protein
VSSPSFFIYLSETSPRILVAKPIRALSGSFEFLSHGKFPLCHWGFVLSQHNEDQLKELFDRQANCLLSLFSPLGTLFELKRYPDGQKTWQVNVDDRFGQALPSTWSRMCIGYIGETGCSDEEIIIYGIHIFQMYADPPSASINRVTSEVSRPHEQLSKFCCLLSPTYMSTVYGFRITFDHSTGITLYITSFEIRWPTFTSSIRFL